MLVLIPKFFLCLLQLFSDNSICHISLWNTLQQDVIQYEATPADYFLSAKSRANGGTACSLLCPLFSFNLCSNSTETSERKMINVSSPSHWEMCLCVWVGIRAVNLSVCLRECVSHVLWIGYVRWFLAALLLVSPNFFANASWIILCPISFSLIMSKLVSLTLCAPAALTVMTDGWKGLDSQCFHPAVPYYRSDSLNIHVHVVCREAV